MTDSGRIEVLEAAVKFQSELIADLRKDMLVTFKHMQRLAEHDLTLLERVPTISPLGPIGHTCPSTT